MGKTLNPGGRYAMYLRKSRADLDLEANSEFETLARHEEALNSLAKVHGITISKVYRELVSGETIADRPEVRKLLSEVIDGKWDGVLVMEVERLARGDTRDQGTMADAFRYTDTQIITPSRIFDPNNDDDMEYLEFGLFMSRREYKTIRRRMQRGVDACVAEGQYIGRFNPYGYDKVMVDGKHTLAPNEDAQTVRDMFKWYATESISSTGIAWRLTQMGVKRPRAKDTPDWGCNAVAGILRNPIYIGKVRWRAHKTKRTLDQNTLSVKKTFVANKDGCEIVEGLHEGIIDIETWNTVQAKMKTRVPFKHGSEIANPLAGLLFCKYCGFSFKFVPESKDNGRYSHKKRSDCQMKGMREVPLMEALCDALEQCMGNVSTTVDNAPEIERARVLGASIANAESEIRHTKDAKATIFNLLERGMIDEEEFRERMEQLRKRSEELATQIDEYKKSSCSVVVREKRTADIQTAISMIRNRKLKAGDVNEFLKTFIRRIEYENTSDFGKNDKLVLTIYFLD